MRKQRQSSATDHKGSDLTIAEVAARLGVSRPLVQHWVPRLPDEGKYRVGNKWMLRAELVQRLKDPDERRKLTQEGEDRRRDYVKLTEAVRKLEQRVAALERRGSDGDKGR